MYLNRVVEAIGVVTMSRDVAREHGLTHQETTCRINLGDMLINSDLPGAIDEIEAALALSRRMGDADGQAFCLHNLALAHLFTGRWADAEDAARQAHDAAPEGLLKAITRCPLVMLHAARGEADQAKRELAWLEALAVSDDDQDRLALSSVRAAVALAHNDPATALAATEGLPGISTGLRTEGFRFAWPLAVEAALAADRHDVARRLLAMVGDAPRGHVPPYLRAQFARCSALLFAASHQHDGVEALLREAIAILTELDYPYWLARAQADLGAWLTTQHRGDEARPLLAAATDTFTRLGTRPDLDTILATAPALAQE
jgi:Tetratricopeptide repeat